MKKSLILGLSTVALGMASFSAFADMHNSGNKWYAGAGGSWIASNFENKYSFESTVGGVDEFTKDEKMNLDDKSAFGGHFLVGYSHDFTSWKGFTEFSYGFDTSASEHQEDVFHNTVDAEKNTFKTKVDRNHTYALTIGASKEITDTLSAFVKLSGLYSQFELENNIPKYEGSTNIHPDKGVSKQWKFGWAPGVGIEKDLGSDFSIKADYSYQIYSTIKKGFDLLPNDNGNISTTGNKVSPRYHAVSVTVTKSF